MTSIDQRWYYFHIPRHLAGSSGNTLIGKVQTTEFAIRAHFKSAQIDGQSVLITKRP